MIYARFYHTVNYSLLSSTLRFLENSRFSRNQPQSKIHGPWTTDQQVQNVRISPSLKLENLIFTKILKSRFSGHLGSKWTKCTDGTLTPTDGRQSMCGQKVSFVRIRHDSTMTRVLYRYVKNHGGPMHVMMIFHETD